MTARYTDEYTAINTNNNKVDPSKISAKMHSLYQSIAVTAGEAATVLAINDTYEFLEIPEGARIVDAQIDSPVLGSAGKITLGLRAFTDIDGETVAEDSTSLITEHDAGAAAVKTSMLAGATAHGKVVGAGGATPFATITEAANSSAALTVEFRIDYLLPH